MRNYAAMGEEKLARSVTELMRGSGNAYERVTRAGDDLEAHRAAARAAAEAKGIAVEAPSAAPAKTEATYIEPMLAFDVNGDLSVVPREGWIMEPKWDGWRWQAHVTEDGIRSIAGRNGEDYTGEHPDVDAALSRLPVGTIIDGEMLFEDTGNTNGRKTKAKLFVAFDILAVAGVNAADRPWTERRELLEKALAYVLEDEAARKFVRLSPVSAVDNEVFKAWLALGMEGAVAKRTNANYYPGARRRDLWVKIKPQSTTEATVIGYEMGKGAGNGHLVGALEIRLHDTDAETSVGWSGEVAEGEKLLGHIIEIAHHGFSEKSGKVRHPVFKRLRPDLEVAP